MTPEERQDLAERIASAIAWKLANIAWWAWVIWTTWHWLFG